MYSAGVMHIPDEQRMRLAIDLVGALGRGDYSLSEREIRSGAGWAPESPPTMPTRLRQRRPQDAWDDDDLRALALRHLVVVRDIEERNRGRLAAILWAGAELGEAARAGDDTARQAAGRIMLHLRRHWPRAAKALLDRGASGRRERAELVRRTTVEVDAMPPAWRRAAVR